MGLWGNGNPDDVTTDAGWARWKHDEEERRKEERRKNANRVPPREFSPKERAWRPSSTWTGPTMSREGSPAPRRKLRRKRGLWS